jgi:hypothetical protein
MKDRNGKEFHMGQVCYDPITKDLVKITNGNPHDYCDCISAHTDGCARQKGFEPTEGLALRVLGVRTQKGRKGIAEVGYTYRAVDPKTLLVQDSEKWPDTLNLACFMGRV